MHIEFLVEEQSAQVALEILVPRIVGEDHTFRVHAFQGKPDLRAKLPGQLAGCSGWLPDDWCIVVLVDRDSDDCRDLKLKLENEAFRAGLRTRRRSCGQATQVVNRIAVEKLEAWFFGDVGALAAAFPGVAATLSAKSAFRDPDGVRGGTAEKLWKVLRQAGHYHSRLQKIDCARRVAKHMDPDRNRSHSFCVFRDALRDLVCHGA